MTANPTFFPFARTILSLCDFTGTWPSAYSSAGYDVRIIDIKKGLNVCLLPYTPCHGILAAPPCTDFSLSGAQYWKAKDKDGRTQQSLAVVDACLRIILTSDPSWWALENPPGRLEHYIGPPRFSFDPCDFGGWMLPGEKSHPSFPAQDAYTKRTHLWGRFNIPHKRSVDPIPNDQQQNNISLPKDADGKFLPWTSPETKTIRSITPLGFARAFAAANP